jgi:GT2 family glycosyltransferase
MSDEGSSVSVSIVVYFPDATWLTATLNTLVAALSHARQAGAVRRATICLVDNQSASSHCPYRAQLDAARREFAWIETDAIAGQGNIGYGRANNLAIARCAGSDFHLVLNPDVKLAEDAITNSLHYLQQHPECGLVSPVATDPEGRPLYLVKRFPDLLTLALRGFAPGWIRQRFVARLEAYERKETPFDAELSDAQIVSGCFMFVRQTLLAKADGFDPAFFLYFEDFDLSFRIAKFAGIARVANVRIVHAGGSAADKGWWHVWLFLRSALRFQWKHR